MPTHPEVLYEDNHLLAVYKPGGELVQGDRTGDVTLLERSRNYIKRKYHKPGKVFLGLVHRLDRPVSGVVLYARTSKAASRLANEFRLRRAKKTYFAVVIGRMTTKKGRLETYIERSHLKSRVAAPSSEKGKRAVMSYRVLATRSGLSLVEVMPQTGRHHQLRLQLAELGHPIVGDVKYGAGEMLGDKTIALHAGVLEVEHPTKKLWVKIEAPPPNTHPWTKFKATIENRSG
jgi:23S rRNA pseudouridine1911/1915/1917 synthase